MKVIKNLLIVLVVLLVLLILISTVGGSIRTNERFTDVSKYAMEIPQNSSMDQAVAMPSELMPLTQAPLPPSAKVASCGPDPASAEGPISGFDSAELGFENVQFGDPSASMMQAPSCQSAPVPAGQAAGSAAASASGDKVEAFDGNVYAPSEIESAAPFQ